jgi:hypothetical protein
MSVYPKRVETFLKEVYEKHPIMRRHPDYRMFYLYTNYPKLQESIIVMTNNDIPLDDLGDYLLTIANVLGFELHTMKWDIFDKNIRKDLEKEFQERRGSEFRVVFYEIW